MASMEDTGLADWQIGSIGSNDEVRVLDGKGSYCNLAQALSRPGQNPVIEGARRVFLLNEHPEVRSVVVNGVDKETDSILKRTYKKFQLLHVT